MLENILRSFQPKFEETERHRLRRQVPLRHDSSLVETNVHILFDFVGFILDFPG